MTQTEHTPTPWTRTGRIIDGMPHRDWDKIHHCVDAVRICILDDGPTEAQSKANAEFIVRACNCHDELIDLLQMWVDGTERGAAPPKAMLLNATRDALDNAKG